MAAGLSGKKFLGEKGIFLTFMSFLLVSTLLALSISISQAGIGAEKNLAEETAFKSANNAFNSIRQQTIIAKEGYAGAAYSRVMPFDKFTAGSNWFEIEQNLPLGEDFLQKTYDAFGLFSVFIGEKAGNGMEVKINSRLANTAWGGTEDYPKIEYIVMPQCFKFSVGGDAMGDNGGVVNFVEGHIASGDPCDFQPDSIKSIESGIHLVGWTPANINGLHCNGDFKSGNACSNSADPALPGYTKIEVQLDGCNPCNITGFDGTGKAVILANIPAEPSENTWVQLQTSSGTKNVTLSIGNNHFIDLSNNLHPEDPEKLVFRAKVEFVEPFDEIVLAPGLFEFGVKNTGFGICRGTGEKACQCATGGYYSYSDKKCWYMGTLGQNCDTVCATHGGTNPKNCRGWADTTPTNCAICRYILGYEAVCSAVGYAYPAYNPDGDRCFTGTITSDCISKNDLLQRICACNN